MRKKIRSVLGIFLLAAMLLLGLAACTQKAESAKQAQPQQTAAAEEQTADEKENAKPQTSVETDAPDAETSEIVEKDGWYYDREHVAAYIRRFGQLPGNYMTKKEARALGWNGGSLERFAEGRVIGGDSFGNREGRLPKKKDRKYFECDIDTQGQSKRGAKRIIYSNDGLIYYTEDHYENFSLLYGEE